METRDTILRLIEQTALILRAFFNQLPLEDPLHEQTIEDFSCQLKTQTGLDLDTLLLLQTAEEISYYFELFPSFDATNQETIADLLVAINNSATTTKLSSAYLKTALAIYVHINRVTQTHDWTRQEKIRTLQATL